jgi:PAS domain S-box-containing protein
MERIGKKESWYNRFRSFAMNRMVPFPVMEKYSLIYWRVRILFSILFAASILTLITFIPVIILVIKENLWSLGLFDVAAWLIVLTLLLSRNIRFEIRSAIALVLTYLIGLVVIVHVGLLSSGTIFLFGFAVLVGIFRGTKAVTGALAVNAITLTIISWLISTGRFGQTFPFFKTSEAMMAAGASFMLMNAAVAISVTVLVKGLAITNQKQKELFSDLEREQLQLKDIKIRLEFEVEEHKQAEEALRESEERYRTILQSIEDGYFEVDIAGNLTFFNDSVCRILGNSRAELMGINNRQYTDKENSQILFQAFNKVFVTGKPSQGVDYEIIRKDGTKLCIQSSVSLIRNTSDEPIGFRGIMRNITERKQAEDELKQTLERLRKAVGTTIHVMVSAVEKRDPYTAGHQVRSANIARAIATEMRLPQEMVEGIRMAGSIHDIGKLSIPAEILSKPAKLSEMEFSLIIEHPQSGYEILKDVESSYPLAEIVYQHHERMDGSGYPRNLKGDDILMEARILAVADVVEAMASHRPHRPSLGINAALEEIEKNKGTLYDADAVDACLRIFRDKGFQFEVLR